MGQVPLPTVNPIEARKFLKVWRGGICLMDDLQVQFAVDFANIALKSFVLGQAEQIAKLQAALAVKSNNAQPTNAVSQTHVAPQSPTPGKIVLTD